MNWLPPHADFNRELRAAREVTNPEHRVAKLAQLAQHRLGFVDVLQLSRALGEPMPRSAPGFSGIRLAILASSTVDHLASAIRVAGLRHQLLVDAHIGAYGQYRQDILDPASSFHRFAPEAVLFSLSARSVLGNVPLSTTQADADQLVSRCVDELRGLWRKTRESAKATIIQQTFLCVSDPIFGSYDRLVPGAPARLVARLNDRVADAAAAEGVLLLDLARRVERDGLDSWYDVRSWLQGKLEVAPQAAPMYGDLVVRILAAQRGLSKKCLVLDLDNTIWGGVVGDDGLEGIVLGEGSAVGEAYLAFQRYAKQLQERGIILAVCSKNDPAIAETAFREHPEMVLKPADIAVFLANWDDKTQNLKIIATRLNIGIDSLVFVDDNPAERARIRQSLPMVAVPELPEDVAGYVRCLADAGYFEAVSFTSEDRERASQYAANIQRESLLEAAESMDDYLRSLQMSVAYGAVAAVDLARVTQLINKTNQFNPTTRRYSAESVAEFAACPGNLALQFRLIDRFGDNGLVSTMLLRPDKAEPDILVIESWVMSCRVFGRELEVEAMNIAVDRARQRKVKGFRADFIPTAKNSVSSELYPGLGFANVDQGREANGATRWYLNLADYVVRQTRISRMAS